VAANKSKITNNFETFLLKLFSEKMEGTKKINIIGNQYLLNESPTETMFFVKPKEDDP